MYKLWAAIQKDIKILLRDRVGVTLMFGMPILLVIIVTSIQNSTFALISNNQLNTLICNNDTGDASKQFIAAIEKVGLLKIMAVPASTDVQKIKDLVHEKNAMAAIIVPANFSQVIHQKAKNVSDKAMVSFGLPTESDTALRTNDLPMTLYYDPILQDAYRYSIEGALQGALQLTGSRATLKQLYLSINERPLPDSMEKEMLGSPIAIKDIALSRNGEVRPNATQHNVPSWTIFAMFFIVLSLAGSIVREKRSGSFMRIRTLPTPYWVALLSKQITYLAVTLLQAGIIFSIGIWLFPHIDLPALKLPTDIAGLLLVTLACGWCAVSYSICVGVFAATQEQANSFGAMSIVILAAIGGLMVPDFAMPSSFHTLIKFSPLHWCLQGYYDLFLKDARLVEVLPIIIYLIAIAFFLQALTFFGLKRKHLI